MNYCINFQRGNGFKYFKEKNVTELKIKYNPLDQTLPNFLEVHPDKTIIISLIDNKIEDINISFFEALYKKTSNFKLLISTFFPSEIIVAIQESEIPFFFNDYVNNWDYLWGLAEWGPTDMYITEELGFELDAVSKILHDLNIRIRVFPNIAQSSWIDTDAIKKFFIRPEDIDFYDDYVDICEFFLEDNNSNSNFYYKVYGQRKKWLGNLNELILDFDLDLDNKFLKNNFPYLRVRCGKRCLKGKFCRSCENKIFLAKLLKSNSIFE